MNTGICPILSRFVTDLYLTVPEEFYDKVKTQDSDMWDVRIEPIHIDKRMFLCVDYVCRVLLPLVLDNSEDLKSFSEKFRNSEEVLGADYLNPLRELIDGVFETLEAKVESEELTEDKENELAWIEDVVFSVRWVVEAALCGSAVIGPLTVNVLDMVSEMVGWNKTVHHATLLMEKMRRVELLIN